MKRLSKEDRVRHKRHLRACEAASSSRPAGGGHHNDQSYDYPQPPGFKLIPAPANISIEEPDLQRDFQSFFESVRSEIAHRPVFISFGNTYSATAAALVLFVANLDMLIGTYPYGKLACSSLGKTKYINRVLRTSGVFELIRRRNYLSLGEQVIPVIKGNSGSDINDIIDAILRNYFNGIIDAQSEQKISTALSEAVLNVHYHAYDGVPEENIGIDRPWWFLTEVSEGKLSLALYDFGIGIPGSLPRKDFFEKLASLFSINDDAGMIEASLETARTRTELDKHGKGGADIKALVETSVSAHLVIYSNGGVYQISTDEHCAVQREKFALKKPIRGTLIQWQIPLESFIHADN